MPPQAIADHFTADLTTKCVTQGLWAFLAVEKAALLGLFPADQVEFDHIPSQLAGQLDVTTQHILYLEFNKQTQCKALGVKAADMHEFKIQIPFMRTQSGSRNLTEFKPYVLMDNLVTLASTIALYGLDTDFGQFSGSGWTDGDEGMDYKFKSHFPSKSGRMSMNFAFHPTGQWSNASTVNDMYPNFAVGAPFINKFRWFCDDKGFHDTPSPKTASNSYDWTDSTLRVRSVALNGTFLGSVWGEQSFGAKGIDSLVLGGVQVEASLTVGACSSSE